MSDFRITSMPASRPADYYLSYLDDSVFIDFLDSPQGIALIRISFDGYGCCTLGSDLKTLNAEDSTKFRKLVANSDLDQHAIGQIVRKAIALNKSCIWEDALTEYELI